MGIARPLRSRWPVAALLAGSLLVLGFGPAREFAVAHEGVVAEAAPARVLEAHDDLLTRTNSDRAAHGLDALSPDDQLSRYAVRHSRRMARLGSIFHSGDDQLRRALAGTDWVVAGENVGVGASLEEVQRAFLQSAPHRRNVLARSYRHAAVGVVEAGGVLWVTVIFTG